MDEISNEKQIETRRTVTQIDGMRITMCEDRFEVMAPLNCEIREQQTVYAFRQWLRNHQAKFRQATMAEVAR